VTLLTHGFQCMYRHKNTWWSLNVAIQRTVLPWCHSAAVVLHGLISAHTDLFVIWGHCVVICTRMSVCCGLRLCGSYWVTRRCLTHHMERVHRSLWLLALNLTVMSASSHLRQIRYLHHIQESRLPRHYMIRIAEFQPNEFLLEQFWIL